jgi:hypothetical protein
VVNDTNRQLNISRGNRQNRRTHTHLAKPEHHSFDLEENPDTPFVEQVKDPKSTATQADRQPLVSDQRAPRKRRRTARAVGEEPLRREILVAEDRVANEETRPAPPTSEDQSFDTTCHDPWPARRRRRECAQSSPRNRR